MKIEKLQPGMTVYDVGRSKMGNTTISSVSVWPVLIVSVDAEKGIVVARWNYNKETKYFQRSWSKWRAKKPLLVRCALGNYRLARRDEIAASKTPNGRDNAAER